MAAHPNKIAFEEGAQCIIMSWTALKLAVEQDWGGVDSAEKRDWLIKVIVDRFDKDGKKLDVSDIEDLLAQIMAEEFNTLLEDDSPYLVGKHLVELFNQCVKGNFTEVERLRAKAATQSSVTSASVRQNNDSDSDDDYVDEDTGDQMEVEAGPSRTKPEAIVDEDGFETVVRRKK